MSLLRLIILGILFYLVYRLLFRGKKTAGQPRSGQADRLEAAGVQDVLVEDPVCHLYIPRKQAIELRAAGRLYHFCSTACRDEFFKKK